MNRTIILLLTILLSAVCMAQSSADVQASGSASTVVVQHWDEELKRFVPTK